MTRSQGKTSSIRWVVQVVHVPDPHISSPASLSLLAKRYYSKDKTIYSEWRMNRVRRRWFKNLMKTPDELGGLTCAICGRKGLKHTNYGSPQQATLDHIVDIKYGGPWRDPSNFQVACKCCNEGKNNRQQKRKVA